ncbi:NADH-FMN oxidoreductase RutF, flavin reductase (DIM6/NTAB) family [Psychrobacillus psychrotolerans]|uniref:NADH-FMN oxidoreductase RutF, flavin reductase (DIM6/NTAB) family n=1 Tax=Psychrobacillus psychrotolerans TaxID=126156 RepID=A0A1I6B5Y4_9BACI|nr:flavin reductase family protein [Psychrobacillus psychrotolerans]SFQ76350.1 NADH-FMN oxidoreductase RutF, flavin reductase (DIM6/NTAB) family [Psychrobacillus psychrotolerans]
MEDRLFRDAMGKFATGVTVITTLHEGQPHGMTANAFMSVSLDPKLVVISIGGNARCLSRIKESGIFAVNILAANQQEQSMIFAGQIKEDREVTFETLADIPVIPNALAQVSCDVVTEYIEGDHTLFIGKVRDIRVQDGEPLLFYAGKYRSLETVPV